MRLSAQLGVVIAGASIAGILVTGWFATGTATSTAEEKSREILVREAQGFAMFVDTWFGDQIDGLAGWTVPFNVQDPVLQRHLLGALDMAMDSVESAAFVHPDQPDGAVWVAVHGNPPPERQAALVSRLRLTEALEGRRVAVAQAKPNPTGVAVGEPYRPDERGPFKVPVAVAGPPERVGDYVLGAEVSLGTVEALLARQLSGERDVVVLSADGKPLTGGEHPLLAGVRLALPKGTEDAPAVLHYELPDGFEVHGALARVSRTGWVVAVVEPEAIAQRSAAEIRVSTLRILGVSVLLAAAIAWIVSRSLSRPVRDLRDSALAVADGALGRQVEEADRGDELGELARAFNHMSLRLKHDQDEIRRQQQEIEAFNVELQQRVEERTRELKEAQDRLVRSGQLAAVAELGAGMAHELNNPLAAILGLAQVLRARARGTTDEATLARIEEQAARCREVVAAMLRLSSGDLDLRSAPVVDLRAALKDGIGIAAGPLRQRGVELLFAEGDASLPVRVDPVAASRIFAQILSALGAGLGEGASLRAGAVRSAGNVVVELLPDRPVAAGGARDDYMAQGMGLWVSRHLLDRLGGRLEEPEGASLAWRVVLPAAEAA
jgi:two-component system NtrC family sensor kinase